MGFVIISRLEWFDILENERLCKKQFLISSGFLSMITANWGQYERFR